MAIPFANTKITVSRVAQDSVTDGYDPNPPRPSQIITDVRAIVTLPGASTNLVGGERVVYNATLKCDICDLRTNDTVIDQVDGTEWVVLNVRPLVGVGLDHLSANLRLVTGAT